MHGLHAIKLSHPWTVGATEMLDRGKVERTVPNASLTSRVANSQDKEG